MRGRELSVVRAAAEQAGTTPEDMHELALALLGTTGWEDDAGPSTPAEHGRAELGRSVLNNDGSPLQACVSCSARRIGVRLIADPSLGRVDMEARVADSVGVLARLLLRTRSRALARGCRDTIAIGIPSVGRRSELQAGALWLAAGPAGGAALYVTCAWGAVRKSWTRVDAWLDAVLADSRPAKQALSELRLHAYPVSLGLEGTDHTDLRAKVYVRFERLVSLARLNLEPLRHPALAHFLTAVIGEGGMSSRGLLLCVSFRVDSGCLADVKIDLCAHCVPRAPQQWSTTITTLAQESSLLVPSVLQAVVDESVEVALLGLGVDRRGCPRLNLYLKGR